MEFFTPGHLVVLAIVALVLFFGWKQLPDMARSMGRSMRIFKTEIKGMTEDDKARAAAKEAETQPKAIQATPVVEAPVAPVVPVVQTPLTKAPVAQAPAVGARPRPTPSSNGHQPAERPTGSY